MAATRTHLILQCHRLSPTLKHFSKPSQTLIPNLSLLRNRFSRANCSSISSSSSVAHSTSQSGGGGGRSGALSPGPEAESAQRIDVNPPKGTRDFAPDEMRMRNWLFHNFREVSRLFGFEEVDFPVLESEDLFVRKAGEEIRDQGFSGCCNGACPCNSEVYAVDDPPPSQTFIAGVESPLVAVCCIGWEGGVWIFVPLRRWRKSLSLPLKWFAIGQCWRYERMTRGRRREHYQWNMDIIGVPEVTAEAELISAIVTFFKRLGITSADVGFKVSSRKVLQEVLRCYSVPESLFGKVCVVIDKMEKIPLDEIKSDLKAAGISEDAIKELLQVLSVKSLSKLEEILGIAGDAIADLKQLFYLADKFGYSDWIQFDASVVRGLAYYTGIVFEGFDREGKLRAICGGGRYDRLLSTFGGDDLPACGFGFGDAVILEVMYSISILLRLLQLLKEKKLLPELNQQVENIVCSLDKDLQGAAATVATILREKGRSVDLVLENKPLKWVFKRAARINADRLILVGKSEWEKGMVCVKTLATGEQCEVELDQLV
ncbi:hypothetical protein Sjap_001387 [Stephania japonica]|uniref:histidine--tRNA ligase n=1 Tax=Stephania japonica TaxID=461633 RepID=A0AAP0PRM3_9MAGN